jgi:hypothetical protein
MINEPMAVQYGPGNFEPQESHYYENMPEIYQTQPDVNQRYDFGNIGFNQNPRKACNTNLELVQPNNNNYYGNFEARGNTHVRKTSREVSNPKKKEPMAKDKKHRFKLKKKEINQGSSTNHTSSNNNNAPSSGLVKKIEPKVSVNRNNGLSMPLKGQTSAENTMTQSQPTPFSISNTKHSEPATKNIEILNNPSSVAQNFTSGSNVMKNIQNQNPVTLPVMWDSIGPYGGSN